MITCWVAAQKHCDPCGERKLWPRNSTPRDQSGNVRKSVARAIERPRAARAGWRQCVRSRDQWQRRQIRRAVLAASGRARCPSRQRPCRSEERRVGKSVDLGGRRIIKKKKKKK